MSQKRSSAHLKAQKDGKVRDRYRCQICGSNNCVEGHHIIDHQFWGAPSVDNIISLCNKHHKEVHRGRIDILKI